MSQFYVNKVENIDWKFAVSAASSEVNQIGQTFLQMKMTIGGKDVFFGLVFIIYNDIFTPSFHDNIL